MTFLTNFCSIFKFILKEFFMKINKGILFSFLYFKVHCIAIIIR